MNHNKCVSKIAINRSQANDMDKIWINRAQTIIIKICFKIKLKSKICICMQWHTKNKRITILMNITTDEYHRLHQNYSSQSTKFGE